MPHQTHVRRRGAVYGVRVALPLELVRARAAAGLKPRKEVWKSLGTKDQKTIAAALTDSGTPWAGAVTWLCRGEHTFQASRTARMVGATPPLIFMPMMWIRLSKTHKHDANAGRGEYENCPELA